MRRLLDKYKSLSAPVKSSVWFIICNILQKGISFITVPIFTRLLTTEQYGIFSVYNSWYSIISILATLNLSAGVYNNCLTKYPNERDKVTSSLQSLSTLITIILFVIYIVNFNFWNSTLNLSTLFVVCMFLEALFMPAYSFWVVKKRFDYKYIGIIVVSLIISLGSPILGIVAVLSTEYKAEARVISFVLVQVIVGLVFYIYNIYKGKTVYSKSIWTFALKFNLPLIPHYLSMMILNQSDRIMISMMDSNSSAAIYSVAYAVSTIMIVVTNAINSSFIPYTYKALKSKCYDDIRKTSDFLILIVGAISIIIMAFGPEIIWIVGGEEYYSAIWVIPPIASSVFFTFLYPLFANIEFYYEKTLGIMIASCIGAGANILLNYWFINIFGFYAAGYTTLFCYILFSFVHYFFQKRIISKNIKKKYDIYNMKLIVLISVLNIVIMIGMTLVYNNFIVRYSVLAAIFIVMFIERKKIISQFKKLRSTK